MFTTWGENVQGAGGLPLSPSLFLWFTIAWRQTWLFLPLRPSFLRRPEVRSQEVPVGNSYQLGGLCSVASLSFCFLAGRMGIILIMISWSWWVHGPPWAPINVHFCYSDDEGGVKVRQATMCMGAKRCGPSSAPGWIIVWPLLGPEISRVQKKGAGIKLHPSVTFHDLINLMQQARTVELACQQQRWKLLEYQLCAAWC